MEVARVTAGKPGPDYDFKKALPYLESAISLGSVDAMVILADYYNIAYENINNENSEKALKLYYRAAEAGSPNAMYKLGMIYKYGRAYDYKKAIKYML